MDPATREILLNRDVIAVDQDPLGTPARRLEKHGEVDVLVRDLADGSVVVGFFNRGNAEARAALDWDRLGGRFRKGAVARDLWRHVTLPSAKSFVGQIPRHGVILLRIDPVGA
jgi:alpha-galactosidase